MNKLVVETATAIDITIDICGILMENGADVSRIESSAKELCDILGIRQTGLLVIPSFITITYIDDNEKKQTASSRHFEKGTNLSKIEGACSLISKIENGSATLQEICIKINELKRDDGDEWCKRVATYIGVASTFTVIFLGPSIMELTWIERFLHVLSAAICSVVIYKTDTVLARAHISDIFTKILSAVLLVITLYASEWLVSLWGIWKLYSIYILMGNIMLIVPGIRFTNGIRDLFSGDVASATIHVVEAVFATVGIVLGVILMQNILSYRFTPLSNSIALIDAPVLYIFISIIITGIGTMCFAMYFRIDIQHIWLSFLAGALTWSVYIVCTKALAIIAENMLWASVFIPNFSASLLATFISEVIAHKKKIPSMIFLFPAIVSLIPGGSLYKALDSVLNTHSMYQTSMITETLYAAGGISCGVLVVAAASRIWLSLIDAVDIKSAKETSQHEHIERCRLSYNEANRLYNIACRHMKQDATKAFAFYSAARDSFEKAIKEIGVFEKTLEYDEAILRYDVYLCAGINLFWMYKCAVKMEMSEIKQKEYLETAMKQYYAAENAATTASAMTESTLEIARKRCVLQNWMAVMKINMARFETSEDEWQKCMREAEQLLESAMASDASYANVYLNTAEVAFTHLAHSLGIKYDYPITCAAPVTDVADLSLFFNMIEDNLQKAMIWNPQMINAYYKMAQLQTYKIFYSTRCLEIDLDHTLELQHEAEKWLMNASMREPKNSGYLFICREYYELTNPSRAIDINRVIKCTDPISAKKWEQRTESCRF